MLPRIGNASVVTYRGGGVGEKDEDKGVSESCPVTKATQGRSVRRAKTGDGRRTSSMFVLSGGKGREATTVSMPK